MDAAKRGKGEEHDLFTTELSGILPFLLWFQEGSTTIMAVPPKGSLLGNEATKLRSPRYLFLALPAQTTPTFFPSIFPPFPTERPPLVSTAVFEERNQPTISQTLYSSIDAKKCQRWKLKKAFDEHSSNILIRDD